ncbi:MAG: OmpH family outer membrane protein [Candidatus Omnitrophota bacterium]|nr:OmpH family outer membrane protein [Candidatus Omnitrophota bacterium]
MSRSKVLAVTVLFIFGIFCGAAQGTAYAREYKIGYVDLARVFDEYKKTKDSEKVLEEKGKAKENERKKFVDELKTLKDEQALLSEKAKAEKQAVIDNKIKNLQEFDTAARDELMKARNDMLGGILKSIEKVVDDYAKQTGYDLVLNSRMLLYGAEQYDLTSEVLTRLNK